MVAELGRWRIGTRAVVLRNDLGISRATLQSTLRALTESGLVIRNPGYGHPLRPEFVLTEVGQRIAQPCMSYAAAVANHDLAQIGYRKWTAPLLYVLGTGETRFNAIETALTGITPRALTNALRGLIDAGLVQRRVEDGYPPATAYTLAELGAVFADAAALLAGELTLAES